MIRSCDGENGKDEGEGRGGEDRGGVVERVEEARAVKEGEVDVDRDEEDVGPACEGGASDSAPCGRERAKDSQFEEEVHLGQLASPSRRQSSASRMPS